MASSFCYDCQRIDLFKLVEGYCYGPTFSDLCSRRETCRFCHLLYASFENETVLESISHCKVFIHILQNYWDSTWTSPDTPWSFIAIRIQDSDRAELGVVSEQWDTLLKRGLMKVLRLFAADGKPIHSQE